MTVERMCSVAQLQVDIGFMGYILSLMAIWVHQRNGGSSTDNFVGAAACIGFLAVCLLVTSYQRLTELDNIVED